MYVTLLIIHISIALFMTAAAVGVTASAIRYRESRLYKIMLGTFGATAFSGLGLLLIVPAGLGRFCLTMSALSLGVLGVRAYYRRQLAFV